MGGSLAVTICEPDGTWHKMDRWTNPTGHTFTDPKFINGDKEFLDEYLKPWHEMCKDFDKHRNVDGTQLAMSEVYCNPHHSSRDKITPSEYGLVYIDFPNKRFYSMQGYTSYDQIATIHASFNADNSDGYWDRIASRVTHYEYYDRPNDKMVKTPISFQSGPEVLAHAKTVEQFSFGNYILDMGDWDFRDFDDSDAGAQEFFAVLAEFHDFTQEEIKGWVGFRNYDDE